MTPQERQLVAELFDRVASLENERRDSDAERAIQEGLARAPHALYALVQTVLVQDEALKRANARIQELEAGAGEPQQSQGGFLDSIRNAMFGHEPSRGSVPSVRPGEPGEPSGSSVWGDRYAAGQSQTTTPPAGYGYGGTPPGYGAPSGYGGPGYGAGGGSFLGTAAASAAGAIGGALLLNSIRGMFGSHPSGAFDPGLSGGSPWGAGGGAANSDLAREAGLDDIGGRSRSAAYDDASNQAGLLGDDNQDDANYDTDVAGDFDDDFDGNDVDSA